jgi:carboxyl-terminal processing protease
MTVMLRCLLIVATASLLPVASVEAQVRIAPESVDPLQSLLAKGQQLEDEQRWSEALTHYEDALHRHPNDWRLQARADVAKIQHSLSRRYNDDSYRTALTSVTLRNALALYSEIMLKVDTHYVATPPWHKLVDRGTKSLDVALTRPIFSAYQMPDVTAGQIAQFRRELYQVTAERPLESRFDARNVVEQVARLADVRLGLSPAAVVFEYICGATGGLDHYSTFLTANQLRDIYAQIDGDFVGLGIELKAEDGMLRIERVIPASPAERAGMRPGERIAAVNGQMTTALSTDQAAALLQGPDGSLADVTLLAPDGTTRRIRVRRAHVDVPSIEGVRIVDSGYGIGYIRLSSFQKNTNRDLDAALWKLHRLGMRSLILDLRGNPGGLLSASVAVADKFLTQGNIVSTRGRNPQEAFRYDAHRAGTWRVPLVVLIDGDSASASEIFAAAMRHYHRGTVVGCRSYGKGSVQGIFPLSAAGAGIRLTTAKFYSPAGHPISNVGVDADIVIQQVARVAADGSRLAADSDAVLNAAISAARRQVASR